VLDQAAASLKRFARDVDPAAAGEPSFLAVLTPTGYAHTRPDGVHVLPLTVLAP
jgi:hypothetical protein